MPRPLVRSSLLSDGFVAVLGGVRSYLIMVLFCIMTGDVGGLFMCLLLDLCINPLWRNIHSGPCLLFKLNSVLVVAELWELFVHPRC